MITLAIREGAEAALKKTAGTNSNKGLARHLGIDESTVSRMFTGRSRPSAPFIAAVISTCPVKFEDVFEPVSKEQLADQLAA